MSMHQPRLTGPADLDRIIPLYRELNPDDPRPSRGRMTECWEEICANPSVDVVVIEHENIIVSMCMLAVVPNLSRGARPFGVIENVVTLEAFRRCGFGRACLEHALDLAAEHDCYKVMLQTGTQQEWKLAFYESCGFDRCTKTAFEYRFKTAREA